MSYPGGGKRDRLHWHSRKKEPSESSARRAGSARPPTLLYKIEQRELRDFFLFRIKIPTNFLSSRKHPFCHAGVGYRRYISHSA